MFCFLFLLFGWVCLFVCFVCVCFFCFPACLFKEVIQLLQWHESISHPNQRKERYKRITLGKDMYIGQLFKHIIQDMY